MEGFVVAPAAGFCAGVSSRSSAGGSGGPGVAGETLDYLVFLVTMFSRRVLLGMR